MEQTTYNTRTRTKSHGVVKLAASCFLLTLLASFPIAARPFDFMGGQIQIDDRFGALLGSDSAPAAAAPASRPRPSKLRFFVEFSRNDLAALLRNYEQYDQFRAQLDKRDVIVIYIPDAMPASHTEEFTDDIHRLFPGSRIFLYASAAKISMMFDSNFWSRGHQPPDPRLLGAPRDLSKKVDAIFIDHENSSYCQSATATASSGLPTTERGLKPMICANGFPTYPKSGADFEWSASILRKLSDQIKSHGFKAGILPTGAHLVSKRPWDYGALWARSGADYMIVQTQGYCSPTVARDPSLASVRGAAQTLKGQVSRHSLPADAVAGQISFNGRAQVDVGRALDCARALQTAGIDNILLLSGPIPVRTEFLRSVRAKSAL